MKLTINLPRILWDKVINEQSISSKERDLFQIRLQQAFEKKNKKRLKKTNYKVKNVELDLTGVSISKFNSEDWVISTRQAICTMAYSLGKPITVIVKESSNHVIKKLKMRNDLVRFKVVE